MKMRILILLCLFGIMKTASASRIVEVYRAGGLFGYYSDIKQTFMGYFSNGVEWWVLECNDPGFVRCRLRATAGKTSRGSQIEDIENTKLSDLMLDIETTQVNNNTPSGQQTKHYQSTLTDNSVVYIYITISWQPDPKGSGDTFFHADISNSGE